MSRDGDTITIGAGEPTYEVDLAVSDEEWTEIQEAIPENQLEPEVVTIDGQPRDPLASAYGAGDFVYLEDKEYKITSGQRHGRILNGCCGRTSATAQLPSSCPLIWSGSTRTCGRCWPPAC